MSSAPTAPEAKASTRPLAERRWSRWALASTLLISVAVAALSDWRSALMTLGVLAPLALVVLAWRELALLRRLGRAAEAMAAIDLPFLILDSDDRVRWASAAFARLYPGLGQVPIGMRYEELARRVMDSGAIEVPDADRQKWLQTRMEAHAKSGDVRLQPMRDGRTLQVVERRTSLGGWTSVYFDVTALAQTQRELREAHAVAKQAREMLEDALDALPAGFEVWDRDNRLIQCNQRLLDLYPGSAELLRPGVHFEEVARAQLAQQLIPAAIGRETEWLGERLAQRGRLGRPFLLGHAGRWIQIDERRTRGGHLVCVRQDVSELVEARRALTQAQGNAERQHRLFMHAVDAMPVAVEIYDDQDRLQMVNHIFRSWHPDVDYDALLGRTFEQLLRESQARGMLPVDAVEDPEAWIRQRMARLGRAEAPRLSRLPDGRRVLTQEARTPEGDIVITRQDVTELVEKERALAVLHAQLQAIVEAAGVALVTFHADGSVRSLNPAAEKLWGRPAEEVVGQPANTMLAPEARQPLIDDFSAHLRGEDSGLIGQRREFPVIRSNGERNLISAVISEVRSADELLFVAVIEDITEQRRAEAALRDANARLERLSATDALTGLANRRRLLEQLQQLWSHRMREPAPIATLLVDVDFFKRYNDHHGHQAGDAALVEVARVLQQAARRATDLVARYGGEEFVVLLDHCDEASAVERAEILREMLHERAIPHGDAPLRRLSVSIGVASLLPSRELKPEEMFSRADQALYRAKAEGRDRVCA